MALANISAVGKYLPENEVKNIDLAKYVDTNDKWIQSRTGIKKRYFCAKDEASSDMAVKAIKNLILNSDKKLENIEAIIICTITPDMFFPSTAALVQKKLNLDNVWGFDLSGACSGFLYGLQTGSALIESKKYKSVIVVGVDKMSSILNFKDRSTCVLFGDGAGAVLLEPSKKYGIIDSLMYVDGKGGEYLKMEAGGSLNPANYDTIKNNMHFVYQDGSTVFKYAVKGMLESTKKLMIRNNLNINNLDLFIPHQANKRIIDLTSEKIGLPNDKVFINIDQYANTTAATIPICLVDAHNQKKIKQNDKIIMTAFGAGFTCGSIYMKWGL